MTGEITGLITAAREYLDRESNVSQWPNLVSKLADALEAEHKRAERLLVDLDARFEHSDHTAAKNWRRMRTAERLRDETADEVLTFREQYIPRLTAAEAERDRYRAEAESARKTGERILADALRYRAAIEGAVSYIDGHWLAPFRPGETAHELRAILTRALNEGAADV